MGARKCLGSSSAGVPAGGGSNKVALGVGLGVGLGVALLAALAALVCLLLLLKRRRRQQQQCTLEVANKVLLAAPPRPPLAPFERPVRSKPPSMQPHAASSG